MPKYDKTLLRDAQQAFDGIAQNADIVLHDGQIQNISQFFKYFIPYWAIRRHQKWILTKQSMYRDTHISQVFKMSIIKPAIKDGFFNEKQLVAIDNKIHYEDIGYPKVFSIEPKYARFIPAEDVCMDRITIYRYTKRTFADSDIYIMLKKLTPFLGTEYDYLQLIGIALNAVSGYPTTEKSHMADLGSEREVCSAGIAAVWNGYKRELKLKGIEIPRLFSTIQEKSFPKFVVESFKRNNNRWDLEVTPPDLFANTETHFDGEFSVVGKMGEGRVLYSL